MRLNTSSAAGFIGFPVSQALLRAGYTVYGQTRSKDRAKLLASNESVQHHFDIHSSILLKY